MYHREYQHITYKKDWKLSNKCLIILGECEGIVKAISRMPIDPKEQDRLVTVQFIKGAQSTTAIEGNTLTSEEVQKVKEGEKLPPSKKYQEQEVKNVLEAFTILFKETVEENKEQLICEELLLRFHKMIGKDLSEHFEASPGHFREREVTVGRYRCPDHRDVKVLIEELCKWLKSEFRYEEGEQTFSDILIQAIITHVYIEWIHPFSDGNGRTGRLVEFYILLRGGLPDIALHLLSNHYNLTKPQYYRELEKATEKRNLSEFIEYAAIGFRDGLIKSLSTLQAMQFTIAWRAFIYDKFSIVKADQRETSFKRRRRLALNFPINIKATLSEIPKLNTEIAFQYGAGTSERMLIRDLEDLIDLKIIQKEDNKYYANIPLLLTASGRLKNKKTSEGEISEALGDLATP